MIGLYRNGPGRELLVDFFDAVIGEACWHGGIFVHDASRTTTAGKKHSDQNDQILREGNGKSWRKFQLKGGIRSMIRKLQGVQDEVNAGLFARKSESCKGHTGQFGGIIGSG